MVCVKPYSNTVFVSRRALFYLFKGPAAEATYAPQPLGLLCNPVMKMISFFLFLQVMEHQWNEIDRGKRKYSGEKPVPMPLCQPQIPHGLTRDRTPGLRGERPATNGLSHGTANPPPLYALQSHMVYDPLELLRFYRLCCR